MRIAIVTGASSGLGKEYVYLLDSENLDEIWLVARRKKILQDLSAEIKTKTKIFSLDLTETDSIKKISDSLADEKISVRYLINSAGFGKIGADSDIDLNSVCKMIDLNCKAAVSLTHEIIPFMEENGNILEICSCSAFQPIPYLNVYAATKSFLLSYSRALAEELAPKKIFVSAVCPYWITDTEFISVAKNTADSSHIKNFPFASKKKQIAKKSFQAAKNGEVVITPDIISTAHRIITNILPHKFLMTASKLFHKKI